MRLIFDISFLSYAMERSVRRRRLLSLQAEPESSRFLGRALEPGLHVGRVSRPVPGFQVLDGSGDPSYKSQGYLRSVSAT